jgi:hypothetical protein
MDTCLRNDGVLADTTAQTRIATRIATRPGTRAASPYTATRNASTMQPTTPDQRTTTSPDRERCLVSLGFDVSMMIRLCDGVLAVSSVVYI